jgi:GTP-binding protein HflX
MADFLDETPSTDDSKRCERAFLVGVQTPDMQTGEAAELLEELHELVENLRIGIVGRELVNLRSATPATLLGSGKTEEIIAQAKAVNADLIVIDETLTPAQQRNWEKLSGVAVIDREEVILDIFADRARTREAVLQVALARMEYSLPRLTRAWTHLSRQRGKGALGGEGETQLEQDRRLVRDRIARLKRELGEVRQQRGVQRNKRLRVPVPTAAIVGYTNAGKSTLLNALTGAAVLAENKLFATLDPTTRQLLLRGNQKLLVTDTVGFIRRLPHRLVDAFKATLEEVILADFLIHVLDVTNPDFEKHHATTLGVLEELGASDRTIITVFNKNDGATDDMRRRARHLVPDALFVSARSGENLDALQDRCIELIADQFGATELFIPHARYDVIAKLHAFGHVQSEEQEENGVRIHGRFPPNQKAIYAPFEVGR